MELFLAFLIVGLVAGFMLFASSILGPKSTNPQKEAPFECGSPLLEKEIKPFPIKYYTVGLLFLLFDIEIAFLFPWALVFRKIDVYVALFSVIIFIAILAVGFIWAWKRGALNWD